MFLKDSMILELLASWKYEKQPVMTTTAVNTIPRYSCVWEGDGKWNYDDVERGKSKAEIDLSHHYLCHT